MLKITFNSIRLAELLSSGAIEITGAPDDEKRLCDELVALCKKIADGAVHANAKERAFFAAVAVALD